MKKPNEDIEAMRQLAETWRSGRLAGDADLLLSLYADEPVLMPQVIRGWPRWLIFCIK